MKVAVSKMLKSYEINVEQILLQPIVQLIF